MPRYRLSESAKTDIAAALRTSETIHGAEARIRYPRALLTAAMRRIAAEPLGRSTVVRWDDRRWTAAKPSAGVRWFSHPAQPQ